MKAKSRVTSPSRNNKIVPRVASLKRRVPGKWRWHFDTLLAVRERLLGERASLLRAAAAPIETGSMDDADRATDEFDHDIALGELSAGCAVIQEVDDAIHRILGGTYGICEVTGKPILAARLRAIPWTRLSTKAEEELERRGGASRPHVERLRSLRGNNGLEESDAEDPTTAEEDAMHLSIGAAAPSRTRRKPAKTQRRKSTR